MTRKGGGTMEKSYNKRKVEPVRFAAKSRRNARVQKGIFGLCHTKLDRALTNRQAKRKEVLAQRREEKKQAKIEKIIEKENGMAAE